MVEQVDRDAAAEIHRWLKSNETVIRFILSTHSDRDTLVQAFARHREQAFIAGMRHAAVIAGRGPNGGLIARAIEEAADRALPQAARATDERNPQAVSAVPVGIANAWQPIETAPMDGTQFLGFHLNTDGYTGTWYTLAGYSGDPEWPWEDDEGKHPFGFLTHWMPLPAAPVEQSR